MTKVLIVDDMATERVYLTNILKKAGHAVVEAKTGVEGIEMAVKELPDVILMDVVMPETTTSGFTATRAIKKNPLTKKIPIIMVTSKDSKADRLNSDDNGACAYLVKPVSEADLLKEVQAALTGA